MKEASVEEATEEAKEATATTTMVEEVTATVMETEVVEATTTDTRATNIKGIHNTVKQIFSNKYLRQFHYHIQHPVQHLTFKATTWTAMQIKLVKTPTVDNGTTNVNTGRDRPNLGQGVSTKAPVHWTLQAIKAILIPMDMIYKTSQRRADIFGILLGEKYSCNATIM